MPVDHKLQYSYLINEKVINGFISRSAGIHSMAHLRIEAKLLSTKFTRPLRDGIAKKIN